MASKGQIQIEVVPDTTKFAAKVHQELKAALKNIKINQNVRVDPDVDTGDVAKKLGAEGKKAGKAFSAGVESSLKDMADKLRDQAAKAGARIGIAFRVALIASLSSLAGPVLPGISALFASIGPAALASVPAAVGVIGTMKVALVGLGDALKEVGSEQEKFNEAIEGLSPNAKSFAQALRGILPDLTDLKNSVQDRFFVGFDKDLKTISSSLMSPLRSGMVGVAGQLNGLVRQFAAFISSSKGTQVVNTIFEITSKLLAQVSDAFGPLLNRVGEWIVKAGNSGVNDAFIEAKNVLKDLAATASNVTASIGLLFGGLQGTQVASTLKDATQAMKDFLASAQGQDIIQGFSDAMAKVRDLTGQFLEVIGNLSPALGALSTGGFMILVAVIQGLLDVLGPVSEALGGQKELFTVLGGIITGAVIAVKAYEAGVVLVTAAQLAWNVLTNASTIAVTLATAAYNTARVAMLLLSIGFAKAGAAATLLGSALYAQVSALAATAAAWVRNAAQVALNTARLVAYTVAQNAVKVATIAWTSVQWLLNAALAANPIGVIIALIVAFVAAIVIAYQKSDTFRAIVDAALRAVGDAAIWLWENAIKPLWQGMVAAFNFIVAAAKLWWSTVTTVFNGVVAAASSLVTSVVGFFKNLALGAYEQFKALVGFVSSLPGQILSALGNVGSLLYNVGSSIVAGLRDGIANAWHWVTSKVTSLINLIPSSIRSLLGISSPSRVMRELGMATGQGFAEGISSQISPVAAATKKLVAPALSVTPPQPNSSGYRNEGSTMVGTPGPGIRMWPAPSATAVQTGTLVIDSGGSKMDDLLVEILTKSVRVRGGNVQRVLGKAQAGVA